MIMSLSLNSGVCVSPVTHRAMAFVHARIALGVLSDDGFSDLVRTRPISSAFAADDNGSEPMKSIVWSAWFRLEMRPRMLLRVPFLELLSSPSVKQYSAAVHPSHSRSILSSPVAHASHRGVVPAHTKLSALNTGTL